MKKIIIRKPGDYRQLVLEDVPEPKVQDSEVFIKIEASGVNYADCIVRWGLYSSAKEFVGWPITPGFEYSGTVEKVGRNATRHKVGDKVVGMSLFGAYASHIAVDENYVFPIPKGWSFEQAAALPAVNLTAYHALFQNIVIRPDAKILVHSAAGGVGTAVLQMCKIKGFMTVGVVGRSHKVQTCKDMGADHVIDKSTEDLWARAKEISPEGYDVILDANGPSTLSDSYEHLSSSGKLLVYGFHSMLPNQGGKVKYLKLIKDYFKTPRFNPLQMTNKNKSVVTFNISYLWDRRDLINEAMNNILAWIDQGQIKPPPIQSFPLKDVAEAHKSIESGKTVGKLVLIP